MRSEPMLPPRRRLKSIKHRSIVGSDPGSLQALAEYLPTHMYVTAFDTKNVVRQGITNPDEILSFVHKYPLTWVQVVGLGDTDVLHKIALHFKLNALAMEDVVNVHQRSKLEEYDHTYFAISRIPEYTDAQLVLQQLSIFWGKNYVITFQEQPTECFEHIFARINNGVQRERLLRPAYLAYAIIDHAVDYFFPILEQYGSDLDGLEENAIDNPSSAVIRHIHDLKRELNAIRRCIWSQRDAIGSFKAMVESDKELWFYLRDGEDHTIQLLDIIESYRDRSSGLMDIYLASVNNRTNKIVKQLTMIATFFMPIGVFAGIYGMNFDRKQPLNMPELSWPYGYIYFWCVVLSFAVGMITWFYRKGWFKPGV